MSDERKCTICGKKLSKYNITEKCWCHNMPRNSDEGKEKSLLDRTPRPGDAMMYTIGLEQGYGARWPQLV